MSTDRTRRRLQRDSESEGEEGGGRGERRTERYGTTKGSLPGIAQNCITAFFYACGLTLLFLLEPEHKWNHRAFLVRLCHLCSWVCSWIEKRCQFHPDPSLCSNHCHTLGNIPPPITIGIAHCQSTHVFSDCGDDRHQQTTINETTTWLRVGGWHNGTMVHKQNRESSLMCGSLFPVVVRIEGPYVSIRAVSISS